MLRVRLCLTHLGLFERWDWSKLHPTQSWLTSGQVQPCQQLSEWFPWTYPRKLLDFGVDEKMVQRKNAFFLGLVAEDGGADINY